MARKSRKHQNENVEEAHPLTEKADRIRTAAYARVSIDREDRDSIETQTIMVRQYVEDHPEFEIVDVYQDAGFSGTNFDRPEFTRMIEDIKTGKIQCVIVKDLSRFGRNFIETGYYIETIFPHLNARLISINDRFDSSREDDRRGLEVPIKNMVNEMYAMDASKKKVDSFLLTSSLGKSKIATAIFGYLVDKENNRLIECPETSRIVKSIFRWYLRGITCNEIARRLEVMELKTPAEFKESLEGIPSGREDLAWRGSVVKEIIEKHGYMGDTVQGVKRHRLYKNDITRRVDPSEWIIHENTHQPLITREDYEKVSQRLEDNIRLKKERLDKTEAERNELDNLFYKKIYCGDCNHSMQFFRFKHIGGSDGYDGIFYICKHGFLPYCNHRVYLDLIKTLVLDQIKTLVRTVIDQKNLAEEMLKGTNSRGKLLSAEKKLISLQRKLSDNENSLASLYVNLSDGVIDENDFKMLSQHYSLEKENLHAEIKERKNDIIRLKKSIERFCDLADDFYRYTDSITFDKDLVKTFIDRITVWKNGAIEIRFKCDDVIARFSDLMAEDE